MDTSFNWPEKSVTTMHTMPMVGVDAEGCGSIAAMETKQSPFTDGRAARGGPVDWALSYQPEGAGGWLTVRRSPIDFEGIASHLAPEREFLFHIAAMYLSEYPMSIRGASINDELRTQP